MPQRKHRFGKSFLGLLLLTAAISLLNVLVGRERAQALKLAGSGRRKFQMTPRRLAATLAFSALFFAGASFSAGAGNSVVKLLDRGDESSLSAATDTTTTTTTTGEDQVTPPIHVGGPADEAVDETVDDAPILAGEVTPEEPTAPQADPAVVADATELADAPAPHKPSPSHADNGAEPASPTLKHHGARAKRADRSAPVLKPQTMLLRQDADREPEADEPNTAATVWLHRLLPDPTPPSRRLTPAFARHLMKVSSQTGADWALVLAVLRASGERGSVPATPAKLRSLSKQMKTARTGRNAWTSVLSIEGHTAFADRAVALQNLYRAVGLQSLVRGYEWAKPSLSKRILNDSRISIYPGGRSDIERGRVNIRVLALLAYLAEAHGQVTVSCLISGHHLYARPGVISAHIYGLAVDISSLGGTSILGHQEAGGVTEQGVRNVLLLPSELQPRQVISLLGLGGPSFPLANHYNHIHVGF